jgi:glycerol-3-phosphate dehydrogenase
MQDIEGIGLCGTLKNVVAIAASDKNTFVSHLH